MWCAWFAACAMCGSGVVNRVHVHCVDLLCAFVVCTSSAQGLCGSTLCVCCVHILCTCIVWIHFVRLLCAHPLDKVCCLHYVCMHQCVHYDWQYLCMMIGSMCA